MIELDADKWLLVKIACERMAGTMASEYSYAYEWLIDAAEFNAHTARSAAEYGERAKALIVREPLIPAAKKGWGR